MDETKERREFFFGQVVSFVAKSAAFKVYGKLKLYEGRNIFLDEWMRKKRDVRSFFDRIVNFVAKSVVLLLISFLYFLKPVTYSVICRTEMRQARQ